LLVFAALATLSLPTSYSFQHHSRLPLRKNVFNQQSVTSKKDSLSPRVRYQRYLSANPRDGEKGITQIRFAGLKKLSSPPASLPQSSKSLAEFFSKNEHRNLLLSKDPNNIQVTSPTKEQMDIWIVEAKASGGALPTKDDEVVQVETSMQFPGLKMTTTTILGTKLVLPRPEPEEGARPPNLPEYQFTLIDSTQSVRGIPPAMWLYNKITGASSSTSSKERMTSSFTTVKVNQLSTSDQISFSTDAKLEVKLDIPTIMLKILPVSVDKIEKQGATSMQKAIEKDVEPALQRFFDAYTRWLSS